MLRTFQVLKEETEPELLLPEIPDFEDELLPLETITGLDPNTPPSCLDETLQTPSLDISSEFELFLGSKLNDHSLDDILDETLDKSLDSEIKTKVENLVDEKPILNIPTPDLTPVKELVPTTQNVSPTSMNLASQLRITSMQGSPNLQNSLPRPTMSVVQDTPNPLPIHTVKQETLDPCPMLSSPNPLNRLSHFDCNHIGPSSLMDIRARFEQSTYLRGRPSSSAVLKLTEPTPSPCLDIKEITVRATPKTGKRTKKASKQSSSNKKQNKGISDNHLLEKVGF
jgi:hypothetical protein